MAFIYILIAGTFAAIVNLCLRKNLQHGGNEKAYFTLYFCLSFVCSFILAPSLFHAPVHPIMAISGSIAGILNYVMMLLIARAIQIGPSGLTFAFQNSGSVFPAFVFFFLFGAAYGFIMNASLLVGFGCILTGLFLSARAQSESSALSMKTKEEKKAKFARWLFLAIGIFLVQGFVMCLFFWKDLLMYSCGEEKHLLLPWNCTQGEDIWFMPAFFLIPSLIETYLFWKQERRWFTLKETVFGTIGGIFNGIAMFFLLLGAKSAGENEKAILFPLFAIIIIFLCSLWGKLLYREKIHWIGMGLCLLGVLLGTF